MSRNGVFAVASISTLVIVVGVYHTINPNSCAKPQQQPPPPQLEIKQETVDNDANVERLENEIQRLKIELDLSQATLHGWTNFSTDLKNKHKQQTQQQNRIHAITNSNLHALSVKYKAVVAGCPPRQSESHSMVSRSVWNPQPLPNPPFVKTSVPQNQLQRVSDNHWVTVATHVSSDRLVALSQLCANWKGPISAAVYSKTIDPVKRWCANDILCSCANSSSRISLKVVIYDKLSMQSKSLYPVNTLRNVALNAVRTQFTLGLDADFVIGGDLQTLPKPPKNTLYILPCFKALEDPKESEDWPLKKDDLIRWNNASRVQAYGEMEGWPLGHMDVNYSRWRAATSSYSIDVANIFFEPYFIVNNDILPLYDERYRGYGAGDKALHFHLLYKMGYDVQVLHSHYILHLPHNDNSWRDNDAKQTLLRHFQIFHAVERMSYGVHQIDFWTRVVNNCIDDPCRETYCANEAVELSGGQQKCQTFPEKFL